MATPSQNSTHSQSKSSPILPDLIYGMVTILQVDRKVLVKLLASSFSNMLIPKAGSEFFLGASHSLS